MAGAYPGIVDESALSEVTAPISDEHEQFADYLTIREIAYVTRLSPDRIRHALTYARARPMRGVKRGMQWFVSRMEALRWAAVVGDYEYARWGAHRERIGKLMAREERRIALPLPPPRHYDRPPAGKRVYSYPEAAVALDTTVNTIYVYVGPGKQLGHVTRYVTDERVRVLDADAIDEYARTTRRFEYVPTNRKDGKKKASAA